MPMSVDLPAPGRELSQLSPGLRHVVTYLRHMILVSSCLLYFMYLQNHSSASSL